jgi:hypothetical protein
LTPSKRNSPLMNYLLDYVMVLFLVLPVQAGTLKRLI